MVTWSKLPSCWFSITFPRSAPLLLSIVVYWYSWFLEHKILSEFLMARSMLPCARQYSNKYRSSEIFFFGIQLLRLNIFCGLYSSRLEQPYWSFWSFHFRHGSWMVTCFTFFLPSSMIVLIFCGAILKWYSVCYSSNSFTNPQIKNIIIENIPCEETRTHLLSTPNLLA